MSKPVAEIAKEIEKYANSAHDRGYLTGYQNAMKLALEVVKASDDHESATATLEFQVRGIGLILQKQD